MDDNDSTQSGPSNPLPKTKRRKIRRTLAGRQSENRSLSETQETNESNEVLPIGGTISKIILKNFLCHEFLEFDDFSPHLNFLQGKNGSGKSAIVVAIIVGLGGSTKSTDRGNSLKGLIQNGKNTAQITIYMNNYGCGAYKNSEFGNIIIVERKLCLSGSNSFKIKTSQGQIVSTKKDCLIKILDWFNIQVDNPITVLSQERAKSFLSSTDSRDLYNFYTAATFLKELQEDIWAIQKDIKTSGEIIKRNSISIPGMKAEVIRWKDKVKMLQGMVANVQMSKDLLRERGWAEVQAIENEHDKLKLNIAKSENILESYCKELKKQEEKKKQLESKRKETTTKVEELVEQMNVHGGEKEEHETKLKEVKAHFRHQSNIKRNITTKLRDTHTDIECLEKRLDRDFDQVKLDWKEKNRKLEEEKEKSRNTINGLQSSVQTKQGEISHIDFTIEQAKVDLNSATLEKQAMQLRLNSIQKELNGIQRVKNSLMIFGASMPRVIDEVEKAFQKNRFSNKPIGPLGCHIKVKDPQWAHIAEQVLGGSITAFLVSNKRDYIELNQIFKNSISANEQKPNIIVCQFRDKLHDYRRFMTETAEYRSMFSILDIDNIHVANTILDQTSCEGTLLIPSSKEAIDLLSERNRVPMNCKLAKTLHGDTIYPDPNYKIFSGTGDRTVNFLQVSVQDKIRDLEQNRAATAAELDDCKSVVRDKTSVTMQLQKSKQDVDKQRKAYETKLKAEYNYMQELNNRAEPPPADVSQLEKDLNELQEKEAGFREEMTTCEVSLKEIDAQMEERSIARQEANKQYEEFDHKVRELQNESHRTVESLAEVKKKTMVLSNKIKSAEDIKSKNSVDTRKIEEKLSEKIANVQKDSKLKERIQTKRSISEIDKKISTVKDVIAKVEGEHGNIEDVMANYEKKLSRVKTIESEIASHKPFIKKLERSIAHRNDLFLVNQMLLKSALKTEFQNNIVNRGFNGDVVVEDQTKTLKITVKKLKLKSSAPSQSLKMMSGGERSFATVSFLVALWSITGSPLTVMDEFDIFMDVVSKNQCVDIILNNLRDSSQYLLISPQDYKLNSLQTSNMRLFRMSDPSRGQSQMDIDEED